MTDQSLDQFRELSQARRRLDLFENALYFDQDRMCEGCLKLESCGGSDCEEIPTADGDTIYLATGKVVAKDGQDAYQIWRDKKDAGGC